MKNKYIVIGASAAGITAARTLRQLDKQSEIICISKDNFWPVNTCNLVDYLITGKDIRLIPDNFFELNNIEFIQQEVIKIYKENNHIELLNGKLITYTHLILALGTRAKLPETQDNYFLFHNFEDAQRLREYIKNNNIASANVIGPGLNGLELASALNTMSIQVNLVSKKYLLDKFFSNLKLEDKEKVQRWLKEKIKINIIEEKIKADMDIFTIGSVCNEELAARAELEIMNGILVNEHFRAYENIWAIGDCARVDGKRSSSWPTAIMHGIACANIIVSNRVMSKREEIISSKFFDINFKSWGNLSGDYGIEIGGKEIVINFEMGEIKLSK